MSGDTWLRSRSMSIPSAFRVVGKNSHRIFTRILYGLKYVTVSSRLPTELNARHLAFICLCVSILKICTCSSWGCCLAIDRSASWHALLSVENVSRFLSMCLRRIELLLSYNAHSRGRARRAKQLTSGTHAQDHTQRHREDLREAILCQDEPLCRWPG